MMLDPNSSRNYLMFHWRKLLVNDKSSPLMQIQPLLVKLFVKNIFFIFSFNVFILGYLMSLVSMNETKEDSLIFMAIAISLILLQYFVFNFSFKSISKNKNQIQRIVDKIEFFVILNSLLFSYVLIFSIPHSSNTQWISFICVSFIYTASLIFISIIRSRIFLCNIFLISFSYLILWLINQELPGVFIVIIHFILLMAIFNLIKYKINSIARLIIKINERKPKFIDESVIINESVIQSRDKFMVNMSHEIRNPLQGILTTLEILSDSKDLSLQMKHAVSGSLTSAKSLITMMGQILELSALQSGTMKNNPTAQDIRKLISKIAAPHKVEAKNKGIGFRLTFNPSVSRSLIIDGVLLGQVCNNLFSNSVKYTQTGSITVDISMEMDLFNAAGDSSIIIMDINDTGIGIPEDKKSKLYDVHHRGKNAKDMGIPGTGLGMPIVKNNIQTMNGKINVESELWKGTNIHIELPVHISNIDPDEANQVNLNSITFNGKVLIVDDMEINTSTAKQTLDKMGLDCFIAFDGKDAISMVIKHHFDVILMDLNMPNMDGHEAAKIIRQIESRNDRKRQIILAVSAASEIKKILKGNDMDGALMKPYNREDLATALLTYVPSISHSQAIEPSSKVPNSVI